MTSTPADASTSPYGDLRAQLDTLTTEAFRPELAEIDQLSTLEISRIMNGEDGTVPAAVAAQLPSIAAAIDATAERRARRPADLRGRRDGRTASACSTRASARPPSTPTRARSWA